MIKYGLAGIKGKDINCLYIGYAEVINTCMNVDLGMSHIQVNKTVSMDLYHTVGENTERKP
jgi:hypothetical protein